MLCASHFGVSHFGVFCCLMDNFECLILGPEGVGKTLLLKKLKNHVLSLNKSTSNNALTFNTDSTAGIIHTVPTAGTNIERVKLSNSVTCKLRECGQSIAPLWRSYFNDCNMVIYVVDITNSVQISAATMLLLDILTAKELRSKPLLIFLNKCDCELKISATELKSIMRIDELMETATQPLKVLEGSCVTEDGLRTVTEWIIQNTLK